MKPSARLTRFLCSFACLFALSSEIHAFEVSSNSKEYALTHAFEYWIAPDKTVDPRLMSPSEQDRLFKAPPINDYEFNIGFSKTPIWVRVALSRTTTSDQNWILEIPYLGLDKVDLYLPDGKIMKNGGSISVSEKPYFSRFYAFPIALTQTPENYYLKVESTYPITLPLRIVEQDSFNKTQFTENLIQALYYGGLLSILIYNLVQFLILRDNKYLLYSLFAASTGLAIFAGNGYGRIYLWPNAPDWDEVSQTVLFAIAGALAIAFTRHFFHSYEQLPKVSKLLGFISFTYLVLAVGLIFSIYFDIPTAPIYFIIFSLTLFSPGLMVVSLIRNIFAGIQQTSYFLVGWTVLWIGALVASLRVFNLIPSNTGTLYAMQISSGIEMLLLSLALAYRFQSERHKREITQQELMESREQTMQAMKLTGEKLEQAVETRTQKLQQLLLSEQHMREQYVRFGAMIAHEFRNPLNIIQAQATMLEIGQRHDQEQILKRTSVIHSAIQRLVKLFDQWLESDRLSQENTQVNKQLLSLSTWLTSLVNTCHIYHPEHQLFLESIPSNLKIFGDDHLLQIAILNLIDNACKYSPPNSQVNIGVITDDYGIGIFVKDQGCGIASDMQEKILEPYFQIDQHDRTKGVGLGLAFVKRIMQAHDGRIEIQSEPQHGTMITLWLAES